MHSNYTGLETSSQTEETCRPQQIEMDTQNSNAELPVKDDKTHEQANHQEKDKISG